MSEAKQLAQDAVASYLLALKITGKDAGYKHNMSLEYATARVLCRVVERQMVSPHQAAVLAEIQQEIETLIDAGFERRRKETENN